MAADRKARMFGQSFPVCKVFIVGEYIVGIAGDVDYGQRLIEWFKLYVKKEATLDDRPDEKDVGYDFMTISKKHGIQHLLKHDFVKINLPFFIGGSGGDFALSAMTLGKSPREAVELAIKLDRNCGLGVDVLSLNDV